MNQALGDESHPWERFFRTLFWLGIVMGAVSVLQYLLLLLFAHRRWGPPTMAVFPRPQLFIVLLGLPALIQAAAREFLCSTIVSSRIREDVLPLIDHGHGLPRLLRVACFTTAHGGFQGSLLLDITAGLCAVGYLFTACCEWVQVCI